MAAAICISKVATNKWSGVCCFRYRLLTINSLKMNHLSVGNFGIRNYHVTCGTISEFQWKPSCLPSDAKQTTLMTGKLLTFKNEVNSHVRNYSDGNGSEKRGIPKLMDFPEILWPSIIKTIRNWILANLIITPYFDPEFSLPDFIFGAKQALEYVSGCLSRGDYDSLKGLVAEEALEEVKRNISTFSIQQRQMLDITKDDIYFSFPYQIGVMFNDDDKNQQRFVEITMVYHTLRGLKQLREQGTSSPVNMGTMAEYRDKIIICNYRFVREFTKGVESHWTVNVLNYFRPVDL
ncbi:m-AAA protease-interacting protein 1, mitochondrial isoform X2 [Anabrus simplex]|uniref:m-AAA protease-interacting protein 1, mitochondrial isoform X2 n=1 Tax=Anabrus simplex TaxID=316456 RepID=UPI0034DD0D63